MSESTWVSTAERGSIWGLRFIAWFYRTLGRRLGALLLYPIVTFFLLTDRPARDGSRQYLERLYATPEGAAALGRRPTRWDSVVHFHDFAESICDRLLFWTGQHGDFELTFSGREHLLKHVRAGEGAVLLGAHFGSFDVLRALAQRDAITVNVLMFTANAERINSIFKQLDPGVALRVIQIDPNSVSAAFAVKACLDRGEFVAILADRLGFDGRNRVGRASFLGHQARFPQGPFLVSLLLSAPTYLVLAVKTERSRYEIIAEPLAGPGSSDRGKREKEVQERIEAFAARLEYHCKAYPYQWFNFYDFWEPGEIDG